MSGNSRPRVDVIDLAIVGAIGVLGTLFVNRFVPELERKWIPGLAAIAVGSLTALAAPRSRVAPPPTSPAAPAPVAPPPPPGPVGPPAAVGLVPTSPRPTRAIDPDATHVRVKRAPQRYSNDRFTVRSVSVPKLGNDDDENEDGWFVTTDIRRLSVADGASSAFASRQWSQLLTESFAADRQLDLAIGAQRVQFVETCAARWDAVTSGGGDWWSNDARARGSFAAFVGVVVADDLTFVADAVGDCCIMLCEPTGRLRLSFPLDSAGQFDSTPSLLATNDPAMGDWRRTAGRLEPGQSLALVSDAVAAWLLTDAGRRLPWLLSNDETAWVDAFDAARSSRDMVNDDVTVVVATAKGGLR